MRKYSEPPYDLNEMTAVFRGICKAIGEDDKYKKTPSSILPLARNINHLCVKYHIQPKATGDLGHIGIALQIFIDELLNKGIITKEILIEHVHNEFNQIPKGTFINYFTGEWYDNRLKEKYLKKS